MPNTDSLTLQDFWPWLGDHCNCILRAGTPDSILYDDDDFHWRFTQENPRTLLVQLVRGKRLIGEVFIEPELVSSVRMTPGEKDEVIFRKVFENNLEPAISSGSLVTCENEIKDARCTVDRISMMHVDAPKYYRDFRYLMFEFFPRLTTGGAIVYQDYFFPYSGSIIAAIQHMAELHLIRPIKSAASSLIVEVIAPIKKSDMEHIDETMQSSFHPDAIDRAISSIESIPIDRPRVFLPRLYLSKLPYYWQSERFKDAQLCVANAIALQNQSTKFTPATNDVIHMLGNGFKPEFY